MGYSLTEEELHFFGRVSRTPEGRKLIDILQKRQKVYDYDCRRLDSSALSRVQGRALEIEELLELFEQGHKKIAKQASALTKKIIQTYDT